MKRALMWLYENSLITFVIVETIAARLRRYRWFREG